MPYKDIAKRLGIAEITAIRSHIFKNNQYKRRSRYTVTVDVVRKNNEILIYLSRCSKGALRNRHYSGELLFEYNKQIKVLTKNLRTYGRKLTANNYKPSSYSTDPVTRETHIIFPLRLYGSSAHW